MSRRGRTAEETMARGGFADSTGPYVAELLENTRKQVADGLLDRSPGTWGPHAEAIGPEGRAKALLAVQWRIDRGHTCRVECIDPLFSRTFNTKTMRHGFRFRWRRIQSWVGDRLRVIRMRYRIWRDRNIANPYD